MIENSVYKEVLESGLLLDHYFLLCNIKHGNKLVDTKRMQGFINLLTKKEYLKDGQLTEKGIDLVQNCIFSEKIVTPADTKSEEDFGEWVLKIYKSCQDKLYDMTRQRQIRAKIDKKSYSFLPNATDLGKVLFKVIKMYKLKDYERIELTLHKYIERCCRENEWFPLMQYYIFKAGASAMVTDMQNEDDDLNNSGDFKSTQKFV